MNENVDRELEDDLLPEYDLEKLLKNGVRGKYVERYGEGTNVVVIAPDVARFFPTEESVNEALRLVIRLTQVARAS